MIIEFPDGMALDSSAIAGMRMSESEGAYPGRIQVYVWRTSGGLLSFNTARTAEHFATVNIGTNEEARSALKRLTAQWMGLPPPADAPLVTDRAQGVDCSECEDGTPHRHQ